MQADSSQQTSASVQPFSNCRAVATLTSGRAFRHGCGVQVFPNVTGSPFYWTHCSIPFTSLGRATYFPSVWHQPTLDRNSFTVRKLPASFPTMQKSNNHTAYYHYDWDVLLQMCRVQRNSIDDCLYWCLKCLDILYRRQPVKASGCRNASILI